MNELTTKYAIIFNIDGELILRILRLLVKTIHELFTKCLIIIIIITFLRLVAVSLRLRTNERASKRDCTEISSIYLVAIF